MSQAQAEKPVEEHPSRDLTEPRVRDHLQTEIERELTLEARDSNYDGAMFGDTVPL